MTDAESTLPQEAALWQDLGQRLVALGGMLTGEIGRWGGREILTPYPYPEKLLYVTAAALAALLDEWEATPEQWSPRLAVTLAQYAVWLREHEEDQC